MSVANILLFSLGVAARATRYGNSVVNTDVAIIGGGGSGAYAAVRLREDLGKKIVVVEKENHLGGHAQTWYDPVTGDAFDYGVEVFMNLTVSRDFFARFNIPVAAPEFGQSQNIYADFRDGKPVNYTPPSDEEAGAAMGRLQVQWDEYESLMIPTSFSFPAGDDIPEDLMLTWSEFARKYNVEATTPRIWNSVVIDPKNALMIDVWKAFDPTVIRGGMQPVSGDNSEIYEKAAQLLGKDVMYESEVVSAERSNNGVQLQVKSKNGSTTVINAKRLLVSIGPDTMKPEVFDLDDKEQAIFSSTTGNRYYAGAVSHPSLPAHRITNAVPEAVPANHMAYPTAPFLASFNFIGNSSTGPVYRTVIAVTKDTELEGAKNLVRSSLQNLMDAGTVPAGDVNQMDFKSIDDHGIMYRHWSVGQLRGDIVRQANALQGLRSTWYTGAYWSTHNAAMVWNTTDAILPKMLEGI
ncbi:amine oxidase-like protein [Pyrenochaeta sp. MPI-SDFR-AT-0127]|nr:amine oxidase-like protein [Pyrenochaeta sp. MPI-SDFR-AT-0127]